MNLQKCIDDLATLVAFDTTSHRSNKPLIDWVAGRLEGLGYRVMVQQAPDEDKANLFASIGPEDQGGLMLSAHADVVPVAGQNWRTDPFKLHQDAGRLYGRGSADMKGFIACMLQAAPGFAAARLKAPVHLALSYNEETNMGGMKQLAAALRDSSYTPKACVIGEPTSMQVVVANKGAAIYRFKVRGFEVHSSLRDQGVSAVEAAAQIIVRSQQIQERMRKDLRHDGFEFPFSSIHVGRIAGGTAHNITAKDCEFMLEIRALPGRAAAPFIGELKHWCEAELLPTMRAIAEPSNIEIEEITDSPSLDEQGNARLARAMMPLCACHALGRVSFGTEGGILQQVGIPTIICGPGQINVAHQADEYVEISQLKLCLDYLEQLRVQLEHDPACFF
ncbi:MAG: acetylornithine deacetylase [Betaproteobacteria bacterium]|jgi:acetylornithine deacetylase|nr:acetylornithine deacetylase [Betaproteobacteria bacterium]